MAVLLLADVAGGQLATDQVAKTLTAVKSLGPVTVLVAGPDAGAAAAEAATLDGVAKVLLAEDASYAHGLSEPTAALIVSLAGCRVALKSGHPQIVCHGLTEFHRLKGSGRGIEEALGSNRQRGGW